MLNSKGEDVTNDKNIVLEKEITDGKVKILLDKIDKDEEYKIVYDVIYAKSEEGSLEKSTTKVKGLNTKEVTTEDETNVEGTIKETSIEVVKTMEKENPKDVDTNKISVSITNKGEYIARDVLVEEKIGTNGEFNISIPKQTSGTTITIVQKEEGKKESEEISLEVYKTRLEKIEIEKVVNTDTKVTGKAKPGADVKLVISRKRIYRKSK